MAELILGGEAFHVVIEGDENAPVLMLSNALGTNLHMWDQQVPALLSHYRVLRYDARGHGSSVVSDGPYSIADLGRDALAILDSLGFDKVDFMGLSLGGIIGQWLLTHAPKRIGKAVLANTASQLAPADLWNSRIQTVLQDGLEAIAGGTIEHWFTKGFRDGNPEQIAFIEDMILKTPPQGYAATCAALRDVDLREAVRSIQAPVLVMVGRHDDITPPGLGALMTSSIPKAKLVTLEAAHLANVEDPDQFNEKALEFLLAVPAAEPAPKKPRKPSVKKPKAEPAPPVELAPEPIAPPPPAAEKAAPKKKEPKKTAPEKKPAAIAAPPKKAPPKKAAPEKTPPKKIPAKKAAVKKASPKKTAAQKAPVKKTAAKKAAPKKSAMKKGAIKKTAVKKAMPKKAAVKKTAAKKMAVKKTAVSKAVTKKLMKKAPATAARKPMKKAAAKKAKRR